MLDAKQPPSPWFGVSFAAAMCVLATTIWRGTDSPIAAGMLATFGILMATVYSAVPAWRPKLYAGFHAATFPIRFLGTLLVLGVVYYLVLTPIALWFRGRGKSLRQRNGDAESAWHPYHSDDDPESYFRTF